VHDHVVSPPEGVDSLLLPEIGQKQVLEKRLDGGNP
jgi:hypothetical protein